MKKAFSSALRDFLGRIVAGLEKAWWIILLAGLALFVIMLLVVIYKNRRIQKLKRELKKTRTQLEVVRESMQRMSAQEEEAQRAAAREAAQAQSAPSEAAQAQSAPSEAEQLEFDDEQEVREADAAKAEAEAEETASNSVAYYNKAAVVSQKGGTTKYSVVYDRAKDSWVIRKAGVDRVVRRVDTKEEAVRVARALCKKNDAHLVVHKKDGKFQKK